MWENWFFFHKINKKLLRPSKNVTLVGDIKKAQKNVEGMNWGFGTLLSHAEVLDSKSLIYNGISFDGFGTLEEMLSSQLYNDEMNPLVTKWYDETQRQGFINSQYGGKSELWIEIDTTF